MVQILGKFVLQQKFDYSLWRENALFNQIRLHNRLLEILYTFTKDIIDHKDI